MLFECLICRLPYKSPHFFHVLIEKLRVGVGSVFLEKDWLIEAAFDADEAQKEVVYDLRLHQVELAWLIALDKLPIPTTAARWQRVQVVRVHIADCVRLWALVVEIQHKEVQKRVTQELQEIVVSKFALVELGVLLLSVRLVGQGLY